MAKIMVADDDPAIIDALELLFEDAGYEVETTVDGSSVRDMGGHLPDLLLLDVWMSGIDGRDICKHLKAQRLTRGVPIILFSANQDFGSSIKDCGADEFVNKPFKIDELLTLVEHYTNG